MDQDHLASLDESSALARRGLSEDEQEQLSKALFPDTHTDVVEVLGETRTLRPLPIKYARQLHAALHPITRKIQSLTGDDVAKKGPPDLDLPLLDGCLKAAKILCGFYGWDDLKVALDSEDIEFTEVQALLVQQASLQRANDFLLTPLRVAVGTMRFVEVGTLKYLNTFSGLRSLSNIDALLSVSSPTTPTPS